MTFDNLSDFLSQLQDEGELLRVSVAVDAEFEIAEITDRVAKLPGGGPALLFDNVKGHSIPVVTNLLGSQRRMCKALRTDSFDEVAARIIALVKPDLPAGWLDALKLVPSIAELAAIPPKTVKTGVCQQVVQMGRDVDLNNLPIPRCWPSESGPTMTLGQVTTRDPETGTRDVGLYPLLVRDRDSLFVHWDRQQDGWRNFAAWQKRDQQMPVAVALGGDPILAYAAAAPLPPNTDACLFAGFLRGQNVELVQCRSVDLQVPAHAEIVIEGHIDTSAELEAAGTVASPTGFSGSDGRFPLMQVTAITHRSNPVFPALVFGKPPAEDCWFGKASERIFLPLVRLFIPEIVDYHLPVAGAMRNLLFVSIEKQYPQQARKVMHALWGLDRIGTTRLIVVVDADVDVHNEQDVWFHVGANVHPGRDTLFCEGPADRYDHACPVRGMGHKLGIDATRKLAEEGHPRDWPEELTASAEISELVSRRWSEYGLSIDPKEQTDR